MNTRKLGRTGLEVAEVGFGAWAIGGGFEFNGVGIGYGPTEDEQSKQALRRALERGVNLIDTADAYGAGHSEELIGEVLDGRWEGVYIATKVGNERRDPLPSRKNFEPDYIRVACERSLKRLRKDCLDVYQLHGPSMEVIAREDVWATLAELKREGKVRFIGASIQKPEEGLALIREDRVDSLQILYNILDRQHEAELLPLAQEKNVGIIVRVPLSSGLLTGKFTADTTFPPTDQRQNWLKGEKLKAGVGYVEQLRPLAEELGLSLAELALRFVLSHPAVSVTIPGAKSPEQVDRNVAAGDGRGLPAEVVERIKQLIPGDFGNPT